MPMTRSRTRGSVPAAVVVLAAYFGIAYHTTISLPLLNDDYVFLDKVRQSSFADLWKPERLAFNWYRPFSREVHYWVLDRLVGANEATFHSVNAALWLFVMVLYFVLVRRMAGNGPAVAATAGLAALTLWGAPLSWVAGAQELWMLLFSLLFLHAIVSSRVALSVVPMVLALLSKETAAILPVLAAAYFWIVRGDPPTKVLRRTSILWIGMIVWLLAHPTLGARMFGPLRHSVESDTRSSPGSIALKTLLAQMNFNGPLAPETGWAALLIPATLGAALLGTWVFLGVPAPSDPDTRRGAERGVVMFGGAWALLGWSILWLPSIGWHSYYGVLGSLGCWMAVGTLLSRQRRVAAAAVMILAFTREVQAATPSWDWSSPWYQTRAGAILGSIRERLFQFHPVLPPSSRLFFARIPNNIGLLAGDGPAIRIWYNDPSLEARYYSDYAPRGLEEAEGRDYFFRFDTATVLVEVLTDEESVPEAIHSNPAWQRDHENLAALFIQKGNVPGAAAEYARLAVAFPERADYSLYAGAAHEALGAKSKAEEFYAAASRVYGRTVVRDRAAELVRAVPRSGLEGR